MVDLIGFEPTTPTMRMWCAPNCATGPNALSKTILYQENLKSKVFFEEKTGKILEAGREIEKPCVKNRKRSERFLRELLDSFGKMMYNTTQQSARYRIGVGHGRTSRGDSGALLPAIRYSRDEFPHPGLIECRLTFVSDVDGSVLRNEIP